MRTALYFLALSLVSLSLGGPVAASASVPLSPRTDSEDKKVEQLNPSKITIAPHKAIYTMSLASVKNGSNITDVSGRMVFEWSDVCDGWAVQQHLQLHFTYAEGDESDVHSTELTWESKDGKSYNFNIHHLTDGKETETYRGRAVMDEDGGTVTYSVPAGKITELPAGTLFPSAHTLLVLQKAAAGERLFSRRVFDGTDEDGSNDVSAFINPPPGHVQAAELSPKLKDNPLLDETAWAVRMAFFKLKTETGEPDYEMNLSLLPNGVARNMQIDYGDFSVNGILTDIEPLPASGC